MPDREYYFFFDKDDLPIAVFYTHIKGEAMDLFSKLYRQTWVESRALGITVEKETDVPEDRWIEIHRKHYTKKLNPTITVPVVKPALKLSEFRRETPQSTGLETEKYMSRM